jgi:hypothetical protein
MQTSKIKIHTSSGIRTHDLSVGAEEDSSCLRPRGRCDRLRGYLASDNSYSFSAHSAILFFNSFGHLGSYFYISWDGLRVSALDSLPLFGLLVG